MIHTNGLPFTGGLPVKRSLIHFFVLALLLTCAAGTASAAKIGYYDMVTGQGEPYMTHEIIAAAQVPVQIFNLTPFELAGIDVLFVYNPDNGSYGAEYLAHLTDIENAVSAGMVLVIHDRYVDPAETILPGGGGINIVRDFLDDANIDVRNSSTLATNGPGGIVDSTTLDGGTSSSHGYASSTTFPAGALNILSRTNTTESTLFSYPFGSGFVVYSTIPLDCYSNPGNCTNTNFDTVYGPNIVRYGAYLGSVVIGYYDMTTGQGEAYMTDEILAGGQTPVQLFDLTPTDLAGIDVLFVYNEDNGAYGAEYLSRLTDIQNAVSAGMVLVIHDRFVDAAETILPGGAAINVVRDFTDDANIEVQNNSTLVTNGPGGIVDNVTLDGGTSSSHGYADAATLPFGALNILSRTLANESTVFSYPFGSGFVVYSTIPLDFYSNPGGTNNFEDIYGPNVVAYAARLTQKCMLCDYFADSILNLGWTYVKPAWFETAGNLSGTPTKRSALAVATPLFPGCDMCTIRTTVATAGGPFNKVWTYGWYADKRNKVELLMKEENDKWILKQRLNQKVVAKGKALMTIDPNVFYLVEITYNGAVFTVSINGVPAITMAPAAPVPVATIGFQAKNTTGYFGLIEVQ